MPCECPWVRLIDVVSKSAPGHPKSPRLFLCGLGFRVSQPTFATSSSCSFVVLLFAEWQIAREQFTIFYAQLLVNYPKAVEHAYLLLGWEPQHFPQNAAEVEAFISALNSKNNSLVLRRASSQTHTEEPEQSSAWTESASTSMGFLSSGVEAFTGGSARWVFDSTPVPDRPAVYGEFYQTFKDSLPADFFLSASRLNPELSGYFQEGAFVAPFPAEAAPAAEREAAAAVRGAKERAVAPVEEEGAPTAPPTAEGAVTPAEEEGAPSAPPTAEGAVAPAEEEGAPAAPAAPEGAVAPPKGVPKLPRIKKIPVTPVERLPWEKIKNFLSRAHGKTLVRRLSIEDTR